MVLQHDDALSDIASKIIQFRDKRDWAQFHDPKNLAQALSIEAAELQEIFLWLTTEESRRLSADKLEQVQEEIADIFIYLTYLCHAFNIDLMAAVAHKLEMNASKYPVIKAKGNRRKYTNL
jgi:NTP pyrophosphatase (non-canonical NTP hydrolase)